jgi:hypothetical protein
MQNELVIGGYSIDTIENLDINITKEVYNIDDPSKRQSDFSKSVEIPGSKANDFVFKSLFDVSFSIRNNAQLSPDFNPTKKAWCIYYQDTLPQINGYCQLNEVKILDNNQVIYVLTIYGKNIDIFSRIADLKLNDLTTLGTATWDDTSIIDSWTAVFDPTIKLTYPILDRGMSKYGRNFLSVNGDPLSVLSYNYNAFKPFIYVKHIIDAIFSEAGINLEVANFFETAQFKKLILECDITKFQTNQTWIDNTLVDAYRNANQTLTLVSNANVKSPSTLYSTSNLTFNITNSDPSSQYNSSTGTFTSGYQAYTNLNATLSIEVTKNESSAGVLTFQAIRKRGTDYKFIGVGSQTISGNATLNITQNISIDSTLLEVGDEMRIVCTGYWTSGAPHNEYISSIINKSGSTLRWYQDGQINYGQTFNIADILPDMKQQDFLMGIIKMFNLYMSPIYEDSIIIEPRDNYYTNEVIDWTYKLDVSKDFVIKPQGLLENKEIVFSYADNGDDLSRNFQQSTTFNYGYLDLIFDNQFVKETKKLELPFTIIPLQADDDKNIIMRTIYDGQPQEKSQKPIVAYFGGMNQSGKLRYWNYNTTAKTDYTNIPFAGHVDDIQNPSYDLAFSQQDFYYYTTPNTTGLKLTNNNLYNQFHKRQWEEIGDKDSKLVEAYFKLSVFDIATLDFRKKYWVNGNAYRLLKVEDFDPMGNQTTLVKLLKLVEKNPIVPTVTTKNGGNGQGGTKVGSGETDGSNPLGNVIKKGILNADTGNDINDNTVGVVITGGDNTLGGNNSNITILGSGNVILPNVCNVALINTNNITVSECNVTYIDGVQYTASKYYGAFHDTTSQFAALTTANYPITFNHTDLSNGVSIGSPTSRIVFDHAGTYNITWSVQYVNSNVQIHDTNIFMRLNGVDVSNSNSKVSIPNSHGGVYGHNITTVNLMLSVSANDYIELVWNTNNTDVSIETIPAVVTPQTPESPSVILTVQQI